MRRVVMRLAAFVPLLVLLQAMAVPVPRVLTVPLDAHAAKSCRPLAQCCPVESDTPCGAHGDREGKLPPVVCCILCQCGIGLTSPAPAVPPPPIIASLAFPPGPSLQSIDVEPTAPPPEPSMSV